VAHTSRKREEEGMKVKRKRKEAEKENSSNISSVRLTKQVTVHTQQQQRRPFWLLCWDGRDHKVEHQTRFKRRAETPCKRVP
jgi:hypothetical protein